MEKQYNLIFYRETSKMFKPKTHALLAAAPVWADNDAQFKQADAAYQAGNYFQAFCLFRPLAQQGNAKAQYRLGKLYEEGKGVIQDNRQAIA